MQGARSGVQSIPCPQDGALHSWASIQDTSMLRPFIVSLCDCLGAIFAALRSLHVDFFGIAAETDASLRDFVRQKWPQVHSWIDALELTPEEVMKQFRRRQCSSILLIAGTPCQPFSALGHQHTFDDPR
eukprot:6455961-Amphidinium_carterae.1